MRGARPRVLVCEEAPAALLAALADASGPGAPVDAVYLPQVGSDPMALQAALASGEGFDALVIRNRTRVGPELLQAAMQPANRRLRVVGRLGAGLDNIDLPAARQCGVAVVYAPWANAVSVAEHALALILALARRLTCLDAACRRGLWRRDQYGLELRGRTLGILGYGAVGRHLAPMAQALGMRVITHHPRRAPDHPDLAAAHAEWVAEDALFQRSDVLSVHLPDRADTRGYLDARRLSLLPRGALVVNTGRGSVVCESALAEALRSGHLGGAALDVRRQEPPPGDDPLAALDNVILTPHVAGLTEAAQARVGRQVAEDVRRVLAGLSPLRPAPG